MKPAYYNEIDPYAAQWIRNLIAAGHIADGVVDERSITDVHADDLKEFVQCHFFAGIGVWSYALRKAGWDDSRPVWTGSCPCQPFSVAGTGAGTTDERHLWPTFFKLIDKRRPPVVFGEQVEAAIRHGWLDLVQADLEGIGYAVAAAGIPAAGVGAPHIRQRLWFVGELANAEIGRSGTRRADDATRLQVPSWGSGSGESSRLGNNNNTGLEGLRSGHQTENGRDGAVRPVAEAGEFGGVADTRSTHSRSQEQTADYGRSETDGPADWVGGCSSASSALADTSGGRVSQEGWRPNGRVGQSGIGEEPGLPGPTNGFWRDADWLFCRDGKWRAVESGYEQMVDGSAGSLGRVCPADVEKIEREINAWSLRHKTDAGKALRNLWYALHAEAVCEREVGRFSGIHSPAVLLSFLRQLTKQGWYFADSLTHCCKEESRVVLRILRFDREAARTPLRRELAEQFGGEFADSLRELSSVLAHHAEASWGEACREKTGAASFPLSVGASARVGRLRAYGNAVCAQVAEEFIAAYLSVRP